ncbi:MAG: hypothetical protein QW445_00200 [Candidatus Bathyarchaeia archaeon]
MIEKELKFNAHANCWSAFKYRKLCQNAPFKKRRCFACKSKISRLNGFFDFSSKHIIEGGVCLE